MMPSRIPSRILPIDGPASPRNQDIGWPTGTDVVAPYNPNANIPLRMSGNRPVIPTVAAPAKPTFRTSTMLQGSLIRRVEPVYPPTARIARIQGAVVLEAIIAKDGTMQQLHLISGHPMLVKAAIDAVSQWRYKPYVLNGEAIEVETQITVNFILN